MKILNIFQIPAIIAGVFFATQARCQSTYPATVENQSTKFPCFDISRSVIESETGNPMLVNKCTGETWILVKTRILDSSGKDEGAFSFEWFPISMTNRAAILGYSQPKITQIPQRHGSGPFQ